jgi:glycosyltransferase involved in cell wall biosynthesis
LEKLVRVTTIPLSLEKLLEGQLTFMNQYYDVIAVSAEKERLRKFGNVNGVKVFDVALTREITPLKDLFAVYRLTKFLKKERPLIIHTHTPKAGIIGMISGLLVGVPIRLHTVAGLPLLEITGGKRKILNFVERLTYKLATRVYPNSYELKKIVLDLNFTKPEKLKVLGSGSSNGIDTEYFNPALYDEDYKILFREKLRIPHNDFVFIFVGRLVKEKGINELVSAFSNLQEKHPDISLLLVGPFEQDLDPLDEKTLKTINTHPKIRTTGYQVDVRPYFAVSNVLTFPSYREGFPNVVMQAGAMALPAIVTNINGCNEIINEEENGLIIPVKDEIALNTAMALLKENPELNKELTLNARQMIQSHYERKQFWKILLKEYKELEGLHKHD